MSQTHSPQNFVFDILSARQCQWSLQTKEISAKTTCMHTAPLCRLGNDLTSLARWTRCSGQGVNNDLVQWSGAKTIGAMEAEEAKFLWKVLRYFICVRYLQLLLHMYFRNATSRDKSSPFPGWWKDVSVQRSVLLTRPPPESDLLPRGNFFFYIISLFLVVHQFQQSDGENLRRFNNM